MKLKYAFAGASLRGLDMFIAPMIENFGDYCEKDIFYKKWWLLCREFRLKQKGSITVILGLILAESNGLLIKTI